MNRLPALTCVLLALLAGCEVPKEDVPVVTNTAPPVVTWRGKTLRQNDVVRIYKWAGTFKPEETGYHAQVNADTGRTGIVLRGERRIPEPDTDVDRREPIQIVRVRWHPQRWKVFARDEWVPLGEFEATIHVEHVEVVR